AVETPGNCWRRLGRPAVTFHANRPCVSLGPVSFSDGFLRILTRTFRADVGAHDATAPDYLSAHRQGFRPFAICNPLALPRRQVVTTSPWSIGRLSKAPRRDWP